MITEDNTGELVIPKESLVFIPLGGVGEIGMNFYLYHYEGKWLIVDLGIGFPGDSMPGVEIMLPDPSFIEKHKKDIVGLIITHAHEDHLGGVSYLWRSLNCPIYLSAFAAEMLESKLEDSGLLGRVELRIVEKGSKIKLGPFSIEFISLTHSIPEANGLAITTKAGTIFHSGDWKFEEEALLGESYDIKALKRIGSQGVLAMIGDSTNVFTQEASNTEQDVRANLIDLFSHYGQNIIVTCFASNVARIESIAYAASQNGRKVCLMGRSLWRVEDAARAIGYLSDTEEFLSEEEAEELNPGDVLYICTGSQGEPYSALTQLSQRGNRYPRLGKGDVVIFSSRVIPGNEYAISKLQNRILSTGAEVITERESLVHVSGHPSRSNMKRMYDIIRPKISIPVHGDLSHLLEHVKLAEECKIPFSFAIKDGEAVLLDNDEPRILGEVETGVLAVDGNRLISVGANVFKKRRKIIESGSAVVTVVLTKDYKVVGDPHVSSFDILDPEKDDILSIELKIKLAVESIEETRRDNDEAVKEVIKATLRRCIMESHGKKPMVDVHLVRL